MRCYVRGRDGMSGSWLLGSFFGLRLVVANPQKRAVKPAKVSLGGEAVGQSLCGGLALVEMGMGHTSRG